MEVYRAFTYLDKIYWQRNFSISGKIHLPKSNEKKIHKNFKSMSSINDTSFESIKRSKSVLSSCGKFISKSIHKVECRLKDEVHKRSSSLIKSTKLPTTREELEPNNNMQVEKELQVKKKHNVYMDDCDTLFGTNIWYYGALDISVDCDTTNTYFNGSIVARIDDQGDVTCTVLCIYKDKLYVEKIPYQEGCYCLDFSDEDQPRFRSLRLLVTYLVQNEVLERVTFSWLLENGLC